jgi:hypothetical protein
MGPSAAREAGRSWDPREGRARGPRPLRRRPDLVAMMGRRAPAPSPAPDRPAADRPEAIGPAAEPEPNGTCLGMNQRR